MPILILRWRLIIDFCIEWLKARVVGDWGAYRAPGTSCFCSRGKADASELNHSIVADWIGFAAENTRNLPKQAAPKISTNQPSSISPKISSAIFAHLQKELFPLGRDLHSGKHLKVAPGSGSPQISLQTRRLLKKWVKNFSLNIIFLPCLPPFNNAMV